MRRASLSQAVAKCFQFAGLYLNDHDSEDWIPYVMCNKRTNEGCSDPDKNQFVRFQQKMNNNNHSEPIIIICKYRPRYSVALT